MPKHDNPKHNDHQPPDDHRPNDQQIEAWERLIQFSRHKNLKLRIKLPSNKKVSEFSGVVVGFGVGNIRVKRDDGFIKTIDIKEIVNLEKYDPEENVDFDDGDSEYWDGEYSDRDGREEDSREEGAKEEGYREEGGRGEDSLRAEKREIDRKKESYPDDSYQDGFYPDVYPDDAYPDQSQEVFYDDREPVIDPQIHTLNKARSRGNRRKLKKRFK